jgi:hypothetical protein
MTIHSIRRQLGNSDGQVVAARLVAAAGRFEVPPGGWVTVAAQNPSDYPLTVTCDGETGVGTIYVHSPSRWRVPGRVVISPSAAAYVMAATAEDVLPEGFSGAPGSGAGVERATAYTAAQSSTANIPSAAGDGVDLSSRRGVRALISAPAAQTITALTVVWWVYDSTLTRWCESPVQDSPPTGRRDATTPDQLSIPTGRAFAEVRSSTCSGAGSFSVILVAA